MEQPPFAIGPAKCVIKEASMEPAAFSSRHGFFGRRLSRRDALRIGLVFAASASAGLAAACGGAQPTAPAKPAEAPKAAAPAPPAASPGAAPPRQRGAGGGPKNPM